VSHGPSEVASRLVCAPMERATLAPARRLLGGFLGADEHYRAAAQTYGDGGAPALERALELFLERPEIGFVWIAFLDGAAVGACVCCYAISTARGSLVVKLDDVTVDPAWQGHGVGVAMLTMLAAWLRERGVSRIDSSCHRDNTGAWRFYQRLGFRGLDEERIALLL
jgi:GNAT superfamily N-acetyltransferase